MKAATVLSLSSIALASPTIPHPGGPAPLLKTRDTGLFADRYIVKLRDAVTTPSFVHAKSLFPGDPVREYDLETFKGFAATLDEAALARLQRHPDVEYIEQDAKISATAYVTQPNAPWGLARISHRALGPSDYIYDESAGSGVCAYVLDSGIRITHTDMGGRATFLAKFSQSDVTTDVFGHGTHVAGILGGTTFGVAKRAQILAVKVLDDAGNGWYSDLLAAFEFVIADASSRDCPNGAVVNISFGGDKSPAVNAAAASVVSAGIFMAVAAGNSNANTTTFVTPASEPTVCTVGATTPDDMFADYSNYGYVIDILAPGSSILSAGVASDDATRILSGTSMAAPHVAGLAAYLLALEGPRDPIALCSRIAELATKDALGGKIGELPGGMRDTVNLVAFNGNPSS